MPEPHYTCQETESPIEREFLWAICKYVAAEATVKTQEWVDTGHGMARLDVLVTSPRGAIAFECDGKEWHKDTGRDEFRDALILASGAAKVVYRFMGRDLASNSLESVLYLATLIDPWVFSARGMRCLGTLVGPELREAAEGFSPQAGESLIALDYMAWEESKLDAEGPTGHRRLSFRRHSLEGRSFLNCYVEFCKNRPGGKIADHYAAWRVRKQ